jgi:hypothetical protein
MQSRCPNLSLTFQTNIAIPSNVGSIMFVYFPGSETSVSVPGIYISLDNKNT